MPGSAVGTPAYMSPEQARGELNRLSPRSDVYSLGATLYCLLTGKPPFEGEDIGAVLRAVQEGVFSRPSQHDSALDKALEAICLKAMATQPEDRYPTPKALADDLDRWMADEPVTAWREPFARRARRWATRYRTAVTGAAVALVAGVVGLSALLAVQTRAKAEIARSLANETRANAALALANTELTRSKTAVQDRYELAVDAIKTFHTGVSEDFLLKQPQFKDLRDRLLKSASDFYGKLGALLGRETDFQSRRALSQAQFELADLTEKVGRKEDALAAHRAVLVRREALASDSDADPEARADVGRSLTAVASLLGSTRRTAEAEVTYRKAESLLAALARTSPPALAALAACRARLGNLLSETGKSADAMEAYRLARADQEALAEGPAATNKARSDLAETLIGLGFLLKDMIKQPTAAEAEFRAAVAIYRKLSDDNPAVVDFRNRLAYGHNGLGNLLYGMGKMTAAEAEYREALALWQKLADDNSAVADFRNRVAGSHNNLGNMLVEAGRLTAAEAEYGEALAILQRLADDNPAVADYRNRLATVQQNLAFVLSKTGKPTAAEAEYRNALATRRRLADDSPVNTDLHTTLAGNLQQLGTILWDIGRRAEAEAQWRESLAIQRKLADDHPGVSKFRDDQASLHLYLGVRLSHTEKADEGEAELRRAIAISQTLADANPSVPDYRGRLAESHLSLGNLLLQEGKSTVAEADIRGALAIYRKLADDLPEARAHRHGLASALDRLGDLARRLGRPAEARDRDDQSIALRERLIREEPTSTTYRGSLAFSLRRRGLARRDLGDPAGSAADVRRALELFDGLPYRQGEQWFETACCHATLAGLAGLDGAGVSAAEGEAAAAQAMGLLRKAVDMSYRGGATYRTEDALDPLRNRPDFRLLMMDLVVPAKPFAGDD